MMVVNDKRPPILMKKKLILKRAPVNLDDNVAIAGMISQLSSARYGGLKIHLCPVQGGGIQASVQVSRDGDSWSVSIKADRMAALRDALATKCRVLRIAQQ
jgi:hypothetical protein